jgi:hypothetical protein
MRYAAEYQSLLMKAVGFSASDLPPNRNGQLSEAQCRRLSSIRTQNALKYSVLAIVFGSFTVLFQVAPSWKHSSSSTIATVFFGALVALFVFGLIAGQQQFASDLKQGRVCSVTGLAILESEVQRRNRYEVQTRYFMTIQNTKFKLSKKLYVAFKHLEPYTVYYAPNSKIILADEPLQP